MLQCVISPLTPKGENGSDWGVYWLSQNSYIIALLLYIWSIIKFIFYCSFYNLLVQRKWWVTQQHLGVGLLDLLLEADTSPHIGSEEPTNAKGMGEDVQRRVLRFGEGRYITARIRVWPCHRGGRG